MYAEPPESVHVIRDERYGPDERNFLDVFIPKGKGPERVVLVFVHGGGFFSGDKAWSEKVSESQMFSILGAHGQSQCYGNVGYCFAQQDIITVIANHQLVPKANYPGGADDMQLIREWVHENISKSEYGNGSAQKVVLFGHSSGGAHLCMNLFAAGRSPVPASQDVLRESLHFQAIQIDQTKTPSGRPLRALCYGMCLSGSTIESQCDKRS